MAFPDYAEFIKQVEAFERLPLNSTERRAGFAAFAGHVLIRRGAGGGKFPALWGKHKESIAKMSNQKCVYCEGPINALRAAHVEHFMPKALFPSRAYEWTNYFLGCPGCNGAKSDKWPVSGGYIRPDRGDPGHHFSFHANGSMKAVRTGSAAARMIEDLELDRRWLVNRRRFHIKTMLSLLKDVVGICDKGQTASGKRLAKTILRNARDPDAPYSVAVEQCFWRVWRKACPWV
jgi:uncharacterized protein (TIGR02646 family)